jgi:hypothetical protein
VGWAISVAVDPKLSVRLLIELQCIVHEDRYFQLVRAVLLGIFVLLQQT